MATPVGALAAAAQCDVLTRAGCAMQNIEVLAFQASEQCCEWTAAGHFHQSKTKAEMAKVSAPMKFEVEKKEVTPHRSTVPPHRATSATVLLLCCCCCCCGFGCCCCCFRFRFRFRTVCQADAVGGCRSDLACRRPSMTCASFLTAAAASASTCRSTSVTWISSWPVARLSTSTTHPSSPLPFRRLTGAAGQPLSNSVQRRIPLSSAQPFGQV